MRVTIDELIAQLQQHRAEGLPGDTMVVVEGLDNNGRSHMANFEVSPRVSSVAKADFDKGWTLAKFVSRGGVRVLVLG